MSAKQMKNTRATPVESGLAPDDPNAKRVAARETVNILHDISMLLDTGLSREALSYCVSLIENGVNPEALATMVKDLQKQRERLDAQHGVNSE